MEAVALQELSKTYKDGKKAVDSVSIRLEEGEIFGFLGPNGAGKTTTIKLLTGMLSPTSGSCRILDLDPAREPVRVHALSGVMTEHAQMYDHLTGLQNLVFYGCLYGLSRAEAKSRAENLLHRLELSGAAAKKLSAYSTGMRQRLSLARALIHRPRVLFLDEPTSGLDPQSTQNVHGMIRDLAREAGITIFLCTHQLRYAQEICTRFGLLARGRLLAEGSLEELRARIGCSIRVRVEMAGCACPGPAVKTGERTYEIPVRSSAEIPSIVRRIVEAGGDLYSITAQQPSLEDIYFALIDQQEEMKR